MSIHSEPDFKALENNITDVIKEEQIKLGYRSETIRLYYPMESINLLLGGNYLIKELPAVLDQFIKHVNTRLGKVAYSNKDSRFCFIIPSSGVEYVHEKLEDNPFLQEFIDQIGTHNCTLDDILLIFHRYSDEVICKKMNSEEFDYLIYFVNGKPDAYKYCLKFEHNHAIYHRFTKGDYDSYNFE